MATSDHSERPMSISVVLCLLRRAVRDLCFACESDSNPHRDCPSLMLASTLTLALLLGATHAAAAAADKPAPAPAWQKVQLGSAGATYPFPVYSNHALDGETAKIRRVLIIQHGRPRNGDAYFLAAEALMKAYGIDPAETLLLAPQFFTPAQTAKARLPDLPAWSGAGFAGGEDSVDPPFSVSSFQVYDDLLEILTDRRRFPELRAIVLAGHSGGAVVVQQFAVLNRMDEKVRAAGIEMRYVVANGSAYLYFTAERPQGDGFALYDNSQCPTYNDHRYGFNKIVRYAANVTPADAHRRYMARNVVYLFGTEDTDPNHASLDKSCAARAQGGHRLDRGRSYLRHERSLAAARGIEDAHRSFEVVGVGHDQAVMFSSACAAQAVFGVANAKSGAQCIETTAARPRTGGIAR